MLETNFNPQRYTIHYDCPIPWPEEQESKIGADYPFTDYIEETLEEYIIQRYLETLWLPDSITCLPGFINNLRRIRIRPDIDPRHLFDPLLLSVEAIREKYHVQLPRVLRDDGGGGGNGGNGEGEDGIEETMVWFAYGNEKHLRGVDGFEGSERVEKEWFTKMEYREMKIQILLCLHILSLQKQKQSTEETNSTKSKSLGIPSTPTKKRIETTTKTPATTLSSLSPMKPIFPPTESMTIEREQERERRKKRREKKTDCASAKEKKTQVDIEERLELLMDRLSIAQLMANLQTQTSVSGISTTTGVSQPSTSVIAPSSNQVSQDTQRDWMQVFCEDIVKPLFQDSLPTFYTLLHSKVFSHSSFSDESDNTTTNNNTTTLPPTLILRPQRKFKAKEKRPAQQPPSPLKLHEVAKSRGTLVRAASAIITGPGSGSTTEKGMGGVGGNGGGKRSQTPQLQLSYPSHRSRSVSISVEEVRARGASRGGVASSKALFQGEFEMRRSSSVKSGGKLFQSNQTSRAQGSLLSKSHPQPHPHPPGLGSGRVKETNKPKTLVFDTPVKKLYPSRFVTASGASPFVDERDEKEKSEFVMGDEFQWSSEEDNNNNALNVNSGTRVGLASGRTLETQVFVMDTPVKSRDG